MSISSPLFNSLQNAGKNAAASERAALLSSASNNESSTSFSQMLRETAKPVAPPPAPAPAPNPPAASAAPKHDGEIKPERQRQDAKAALKRPEQAKPSTTPTKPADPAQVTAPSEAADDKTTAAADATDTEVDAKANKTRDPADDLRCIADPKLAPDTAPVPVANAGPQILALLAKAGIAPDGAAAKPDAAADRTADERPALTTATSPRGSARTDAAAGRAVAAADAKPAAELAARDFAAELLNTSAALPQAVQAIKGGGPARGEGASIDGLLSAAAANPTSVNQAAAPDTPTIALAQPLYEPGFAPELAARVSLLAADGVQEAQLHLNPAEMGPVAVQIVVDGQQAQISFHAEQADTRAVLEQSMPDLAAALRDSGLTLSGGGVFQQMRDQGQASQRQAGEANERRSARVAGGGGADGPQAVGRTAPAPRATRGVVDLYA